MTDVVSEQRLEPPCTPVTCPGQDRVEKCEEPQGRWPPRLVDLAPLPSSSSGGRRGGQHRGGPMTALGLAGLSRAVVQLQTEGACDAEAKGPAHPLTLLSIFGESLTRVWAAFPQTPCRGR